MLFSVDVKILVLTNICSSFLILEVLCDISLGGKTFVLCSSV